MDLRPARDPLIQEILDRAAAAWPRVAVDPEIFARHLAERVAPAALAALHAEDLYLACACARGDAAAIHALERGFLTEVPLFLSHLRPDSAFIDEVQQHLRQHLLVGSADRPPRIAEYTGRGPLRAWLRVTTARSALNLRRRTADQASRRGSADTTLLADPRHGPELDFIKARYGADFKAAFAAALGALSSEHRRALRLHFVDGLGIDGMALALGVHRATAARRLQAARMNALQQTRHQLRQRLRLEPAEFDSLIALVRSQMHLSIARLLASDHTS